MTKTVWATNSESIILIKNQHIEQKINMAVYVNIIMKTDLSIIILSAQKY
jgi:hypothetical protein